MQQLVTISLILFVLISRTCSENKEYILNTAKCKIPHIEPFNEEIKDIMLPQRYFSCNSSELLTFVGKTEDNSAILVLREDLAPQNVNCCYSYVTRSGSLGEPDVGIHISQCQPFNQYAILTRDTVKVTCFGHNNSRVYENVHHAITVKKSVRHKIKEHKKTSKPFSVLFIVVDSVSRLNFIRTMPGSYNFLKENNFIEMKGYTKVGDNTFPNAMSLLTGFSQSEVDKQCNPRILGGLDICPMIWYDYRSKGYITAYAEDDSPISTFNFNKKGFVFPPTDYYFKPYIEASETLKIQVVNHMPYCTGPESSGERILNLAKDFATTFKNQSTFGIFWMNTFSHNDINAPHGMDGKMKQFFIDLKNEGVLDESIVVFLSDHGIRFGDIRKTQSGWFEERMPVNMISVPKMFREKFRQEYDNLVENSNRLTSTYDMFVTLQHILTLSGISYRTKPSSACPKCVSLFGKITRNRSCEDAGIPLEWCTCMGVFQKVETTHEYVKNATEAALLKVQKQISSFHPHFNCKNVTLSRILSSSISEAVPHTKHLFLVFETSPSAIFLVTVRFKEFITQNSTLFIRRTFTNLDFCI